MEHDDSPVGVGTLWLFHNISHGYGKPPFFKLNHKSFVNGQFSMAL
jgi:hypothetical protein